MRVETHCHHKSSCQTAFSAHLEHAQVSSNEQQVKGREGQDTKETKLPVGQKAEERNDQV